MLNEDIPAHRRGKYRNNLQQFDMTCKEIALFLTNFLREQGSWLLKSDAENVVESIKLSFRILLLLLTSQEEQIFKIIIEFFHHFLKNIIGFGDVSAIGFGVQPVVPNLFKEFFT